jgi:hypothetical protein
LACPTTVTEKLAPGMLLDWGNDLHYLTLFSHYSSNCNPPTVVRIDDIEIRIGQTWL